jgi:hypothetical protein
MKRQDLAKICRAVAAGEARYLENLDTRHAGRVVACRGETVEIDIYGKHEAWPMERCQEFGKPDFDYHR